MLVVDVQRRAVSSGHPYENAEGNGCHLGQSTFDAKEPN